MLALAQETGGATVLGWQDAAAVGDRWEANDQGAFRIYGWFWQSGLSGCVTKFAAGTR